MAKIKEYTVNFADFKPGEVYKKSITMASKADTIIKFIGDTNENTYKYTESGKNCIMNIYGSGDILLAQITVKNLAKKETKYGVLVETESGHGMPIRLTEEIYTPNYKNGVWSGSWLREEAESKEGNDTFKLAGGDNTMNFTVLEGGTGYGDDTVISQGTYDLLKFDNTYTNTYTRAGNDIIIISDGGETTKGSVTVKDYLKKDSQNVYIDKKDDHNSKKLSEILEEDKSTWALTDTSKKENGTLKGTFLGEYIIGGKGNNKITTGLGDDTVFISAGKDSITIDDIGSKKVSFEKFSEITPTEEDIIGTSTLAFKKGVVLTSKDNNKASVDIDLMSSGTTKYTKSGNTLIVGQSWLTGINKKSAEIVISNFLNNSELQNAITFDTESFDTVIKKAGVQLYQVGNEKKSNTINGTKYSDNITGGNKADKINLTAVGTDNVYAKAGNDTITIAKKAEGETSGTKTLDFYKGDGKDTVVFEKDADANLRIKMSNEGIANSVIYSKTGNNLTVTSVYEDINTKGKTVTTTDTITINDYFKKDSLVKFSAINSQGALTGSYVALSSKLGSNYLIVNGQKETDKTSSFYKETVFYGSGHNDKMTYSGKGASNMLGGKGDDLYDITLTNKTDLFISDTEGVNKVKLSEKSDNIRLLFNIDKDGIVIDPTSSSNNYNINQLSIFNSASFNYNNLMKNGLGQVQVNNFFFTLEQTVGEGDDAHKENVLKTRSYDFYTSDSTTAVFNMESYIDQVKSSVSGWIANSKYSDKTALEIFQSGDKASITELISAYNINYQPQQQG